uniref:Abundant larval transcript-2 (ALT2) protein, putative n=1 Tax=Brugia malayi TaxID=6279 RepID=A8PES2_BRUMA
MNNLLIAISLVILLVIFPSKSDLEIDDSSDSDYAHSNDDDYNEEEDEYTTKGEFVETDGKWKNCSSHADCYDYREPIAWCKPTANQFWTDKGCFCEDMLYSCVIERTNNGKLEYSYCTSKENWQCL